LQDQIYIMGYTSQVGRIKGFVKTVMVWEAAN